MIAFVISIAAVAPAHAAETPEPGAAAAAGATYTSEQLAPPTNLPADAPAPEADTSNMAADDPSKAAPPPRFDYELDSEDCYRNHQKAGYSHNGWVLNRYAYCQLRTLRFGLKNNNTGEFIDWVDVAFVTVVSSAVNDTRWRWTTRIFGADWTNARSTYASGIKLNIAATAPGVQNSLSVTNYSTYVITSTNYGPLFPSASGVTDTYQSQQGAVVPSPRGNNYLVADGSWSLAVSHSANTPGSPMSNWFYLAPSYFEVQNSFTLLRCDKSTGLQGGSVYRFPKGCVFPDITSTLTLSKSDTAVAKSAQFIAATIANRGAPTLLSRNEDPANEQANRDAASDVCDTKSPVGVSQPSCDEYPFASSNQGNYNRPSRSDAAWVPLPDNSQAGTRLGLKVKGDRVANGERFKVVITA